METRGENIKNDSNKARKPNKHLEDLSLTAKNLVVVLDNIARRLDLIKAGITTSGRIIEPHLSFIADEAVSLNALKIKLSVLLEIASGITDEKLAGLSRLLKHYESLGNKELTGRIIMRQRKLMEIRDNISTLSKDSLDIVAKMCVVLLSPRSEVISLANNSNFLSQQKRARNNIYSLLADGENSLVKQMNDTLSIN